MKALWAGAVAIGILPMSAFAGPEYDASIDKAAAGIVAARIGEIRGGFSFNAKLASVLAPEIPAADLNTTGNATGARQGGPAAFAVDRMTLQLF
ncbi:hypothetical protein SAZ10_03910 [Mesorhizobium sp. BAC0120]|uniref:hypothetical protein n=1 Tax=Mesorhizobium sp. BAC0120 TaxID=3090670 RepID=UPI00298D25F8|nr:hypothetical protein [Mesorhizobium sp. BAC0120]MDW6020903.1 hypothetical protein [Mesorhizobium sp. BAC0120]